MQTLEERLNELVNDPDFFGRITGWLDKVSLEKPEKAFSMALDLAGFVTPRVKAKDAQNSDKPLQIAILFAEEINADGNNATQRKSTPPSNEIPSK